MEMTRCGSALLGMKPNPQQQEEISSKNSLTYENCQQTSEGKIPSFSPPLYQEKYLSIKLFEKSPRFCWSFCVITTRSLYFYIKRAVGSQLGSSAHEFPGWHLDKDEKHMHLPMTLSINPKGKLNLHGYLLGKNANGILVSLMLWKSSLSQRRLLFLHLFKFIYYYYCIALHEVGCAHVCHNICADSKDSFLESVFFLPLLCLSRAQN